MNITLLQIDAPRPAGTDEQTIRVLVEIDGSAEWYEVLVTPSAFPEIGGGLLVASDALQDRLHREGHALHRICKLAGREWEGQAVPLPEFVAA